jgi:hypothetical protein
MKFRTFAMSDCKLRPRTILELRFLVKRRKVRVSDHLETEFDG